jgi:hypothetical protein
MNSVHILAGSLTIVIVAAICYIDFVRREHRRQIRHVVSILVLAQRRFVQESGGAVSVTGSKWAPKSGFLIDSPVGDLLSELSKLIHNLAPIAGVRIGWPRHEGRTPAEEAARRLGGMRP